MHAPRDARRGASRSILAKTVSLHVQYRITRPVWSGRPTNTHPRETLLGQAHYWVTLTSTCQLAFKHRRDEGKHQPRVWMSVGQKRVKEIKVILIDRLDDVLVVLDCLYLL